MRVGLIINTLGDGGAERQAALWAEALATLGHTVELVSLHEEPDAYRVDPAVRIRSINSGSGPLGLVRAALALRRRAGRLWDVVLAFQPYPALACALARLRLPWAAVTGDDPRYWGDTSRIPAPLFVWAFRRAPLGVSPTRGIAGCHAELGVTPRRGWRVVPNIVDDAAFETERRSNKTGVLFVGRLVGLKNPELAMEAARKAGAELTILGQGPLGPKLRALADATDAPPVHLEGFKEPWPVYARHRVLVVTSDYESFGNVIVESLAAGTPVVSVDCDYGPRELIAEARYSRLTAMDVDAIATALREVLDRPYGSDEADECLEIANRYRAASIRPQIAEVIAAITSRSEGREPA